MCPTIGQRRGLGVATGEPLYVVYLDAASARVIVEADYGDFVVEPSFGTHFFQNLISFRIGYFTVNSALKNEFINWDWLAAQPAFKESRFVRHLRLDEPLGVKMNGRTNRGVILKPGTQ